jgi:tetrahydromethanopterin S-methyltransferase subunit G
MVEERDDRSLGDLFADLARQTSTLVQQELRQAGSEVSQRASGISKDIGVLVGGAILTLIGLCAIVAALIIGLADLGLPWWLSALLVGLALVGAGYALLTSARASIKKADVLPRQTMRQAREDQEWVTDQIR